MCPISLFCPSAMLLLWFAATERRSPDMVSAALLPHSIWLLKLNMLSTSFSGIPGLKSQRVRERERERERDKRFSLYIPWFSLNPPFLSHFGARVDSTSNRNEYHKYSLGGVKAAGAYGWQIYNLHVPNVLKCGNLDLLEPWGPPQACIWIAWPLLRLTSLTNCMIYTKCRELYFQRCSQFIVQQSSLNFDPLNLTFWSA